MLTISHMFGTITSTEEQQTHYRVHAMLKAKDLHTAYEMRGRSCSRQKYTNSNEQEVFPVIFENAKYS